MPRFTFEVSAQMQGVGALTVPEDYPWHLHLTCTSCLEKYQRPAVISTSETAEGLGNDLVHLRIKCSFCGKQGTVKIVKDGLQYSLDQSPEWAPLLELECRGVEPNGVSLPDDVALSMFGETGFPFEEAFLEDGEFFAWDEAKNAEASVTEFRTRVRKS